MPKDKLSVNPAQAARKAEKARALKKSKANVQSQRNEKLARRNPERLQRQIDDLKATEEGGQLRPRDKQVLEQLERDVRAIRKARDTLGDKAPTFGGHRGGRDGEGRGGGMLGKRRRDGEPRRHGGWKDREHSSSSETDEDARDIPMPRDTPPPIPRPHHKNRDGRGPATSANDTPLPDQPRIPHALPTKPGSSTDTAAAPTKTTYEAAPVIRDLKKEATSRFMPVAVQRKIGQIKGQGGKLLEPEELDRLEREGYGQAEQQHDKAGAGENAKSEGRAHDIASQDGGDMELEEEERRFQREMQHHVQIEDVEDEDQ